jgi:hypothetical protein
MECERRNAAQASATGHVGASVGEKLILTVDTDGGGGRGKLRDLDK